MRPYEASHGSRCDLVVSGDLSVIINNDVTAGMAAQSHWTSSRLPPQIGRALALLLSPDVPYLDAQVDLGSNFMQRGVRQASCREGGFCSWLGFLSKHKLRVRRQACQCLRGLCEG